MFFWIMKKIVESKIKQNLKKADEAARLVDLNISKLQNLIQKQQSQKIKDEVFKIIDKLYVARDSLQKSREEYEKHVEEINEFFHIEECLDSSFMKLALSKNITQQLKGIINSLND